MKKLFVIATALAVSAAIGPLSAQGTATTQGAAPPQTTPAPSATPKPAPATPAKSTIIQKVIVKVNGEIFTQSELEFRQIQSLRDQQKNVAKPDDLSSDPVLRAALASVTPGILLDAVDELMVVQRGHEMNLKFTEEMFTHTIDELKKVNKIPDDATFQAALKDAGMTMADLRVNAERNFYMNEVTRRDVMKNLALTEDEARQYYTAHTDQFMKPATVTLREIVVNVPAQTVGGQVSFNVSLDDAAKQKITELRDRALKGEDFAKLVAEASDSGTKDTGGVIGPVNSADLSSALTDLLDKMKPGDVTEPLRTKAGYQIIKLETRSASQPEPFEKSRDQISQRILESRRDVELAKFIDKLRIQAVIEWKDDGYKKMYEAAVAARKAAGPIGK